MDESELLGGLDVLGSVPEFFEPCEKKNFELMGGKAKQSERIHNGMESAFSRKPRNAHWKFAIAASCLAITTVILIQGGDQVIAMWLDDIPLSGDLARAIHLAETFAHGTGVLAILGSLLWIDRNNYRALVRFIADIDCRGLSQTDSSSSLPVFARTQSKQEMTCPIHGCLIFRFVLGCSHRSFPSGHSQPQSLLQSAYLLFTREADTFLPSSQ